jgi:hypothetical protein
MAMCSHSWRWTVVLCLGLQLSVAVVLLALAGCSTAPFADIMDFWAPGRFPKDAKAVTGGVCLPQGGPAGGMLGAPQPVVAPPPGPAAPPGGPVSSEPPPQPPPR